MHSTRPLICVMLCCLALSCATPSPAAPNCPASIDQAQLGLAYDAFDSAGWRDLLARGCPDAAVAQLLAYRDANQTRLADEQVRELNFHAGQALAMSGREPESIPHFERARGGGDEWSAYVDATLAFLRRDADALAQARRRYAGAAGAGAMRLAVIDGFVACPTSGYTDAVRCGMSGMHH